MNRPGQATRPTIKEWGIELVLGDYVEVKTGGGGYGDPRARCAARRRGCVARYCQPQFGARYLRRRPRRRWRGYNNGNKLRSSICAFEIALPTATAGVPFESTKSDLRVMPARI